MCFYESQICYVQFRVWFCICSLLFILKFAYELGQDI